MTEVVGLLLAAGSARRFGAHKLMYPLVDGTPIGIATARTLVRSVSTTIAVVRPTDHRLIEAFSALGVYVVENPSFDEGMGTSLATGVRAAAEANGWLVVLADMPWVRSTTIRMLANGLRDGASMIAPVYGGRRGHPVGFATRWREKLQGLSGDEGARELIAEHADELVLHTTTDAGVLRDVDRPIDLARASEHG
jgi:molybdenum cofactor cytidylyltransferase